MSDDGQLLLPPRSHPRNRSSSDNRNHSRPPLPRHSSRPLPQNSHPNLSHRSSQTRARARRPFSTRRFPRPTLPPRSRRRRPRSSSPSSPQAKSSSRTRRSASTGGEGRWSIVVVAVRVRSLQLRIQESLPRRRRVAPSRRLWIRRGSVGPLCLVRETRRGRLHSTRNLPSLALLLRQVQDVRSTSGSVHQGGEEVVDGHRRTETRQGRSRSETSSRRRSVCLSSSQERSASYDGGSRSGSGSHLLPRTRSRGDASWIRDGYSVGAVRFLAECGFEEAV